MRAVLKSSRIRLAALLMAVGLVGSGCGTPGDEAANQSHKPWNTPEGYDNGNLPSTMFQGH
jgi:hypothetical protein